MCNYNKKGLFVYRIGGEQEFVGDKSFFTYYGQEILKQVNIRG